MSTPPTPIHPAPDQEVADLPHTKLDGDNLDLNPTLEDDLDDDDVSMQSTRPTEDIGDDKDNVKVEITSWTMPFEDAYEAELLNLQQQKHPEVSIGQQSKLISYLDNEFLKVQRKFVKNQAESRHEYSLHSLLEDLSQILDVLWVSISPEHELFGQEEYFIKVLGDLEDWVDWYDLSEYDCLDRKTEIFLFGLFTFFQKVDVRISLLVDGIEKKGDLRSKFDRTQLVRLFPIVNRLRLIIVGKLRPIRDELSRLKDLQKKEANILLNFFDVEVGRLFEGTLERS
ncbi:hypothetical_protein [Candidozyma auris]|uniref:TFIIH complex subunit TFB6 n=1 Tax=Candidozyma auris TaxID=498019 RepID=UPI000D2B0C02|nr:TFIIH complex subunit TFB6 [[Candida] auris]QEO24019.1 hypothetical_protein [[Candida] auris]GBL52740.1 hypothetical protein CAJCM15448_50140 [[Candida] auris]